MMSGDFLSIPSLEKLAFYVLLEFGALSFLSNYSSLL